jgi:hypothetical protein
MSVVFIRDQVTTSCQDSTIGADTLSLTCSGVISRRENAVRT